MTAAERIKMEKLAEEAVINASMSNDEWKSYERYKTSGCMVNAEVKMRISDYHRGYDDGIRQALVVMGCKSDRIKQLNELLD